MCILSWTFQFLALIICFRSDNSWPQSAVRVEGASLQILSMTSHLNGLYQCEASNPYGTKRSHLYLHVSSGEERFDMEFFSLCS